MDYYVDSDGTVRTVLEIEEEIAENKDFVAENRRQSVKGSVKAYDSEKKVIGGIWFVRCAFCGNFFRKKKILSHMKNCRK